MYSCLVPIIIIREFIVVVFACSFILLAAYLFFFGQITKK